MEIQRQRTKDILNKIEEENPTPPKPLFKEFGKLTNFLYVAEDFIKKYPLYYDRAKIWWKWNFEKFAWEMIDETDILNSLDSETESPSARSNIKAETLEALRRKARLNEPEEAKESWVQFKDKIYDLDSDEIIKVEPKYFLANPIDWKLGESEETPALDILFKSWVGEEHYEELYEFLAFCIVPRYFIHRLFCLIGSGSNGKSTFLSVLENFIGQENLVSSSLYMLLTGRFEGSKLLKKLACLMGETNFNIIQNTDYLKKLTGEDLVRAEFKGKDCFDFTNYAKLIMATNSIPPTADKTIGFYRRWKIIDFPNKFPEEKDILFNVLPLEYENLALKCLNIAKRLWNKRVFTNDGDFDERERIYEERANPLMLFIKEHYEEDINSETLFSEFFRDLNKYLKNKGHRILTAVAVSRQLKNEGFDVKQMSKNTIIGKYILGLTLQNNPNNLNNRISTPIIPVKTGRGIGNSGYLRYSTNESLISKPKCIQKKPTEAIKKARFLSKLGEFGF